MYDCLPPSLVQARFDRSGTNSQIPGPQTSQVPPLPQLRSTTFRPTNWTHFRGRPFFDDCDHNSTLFKAFHDGMSLLTGAKVPWTRLVPAAHLLADAYQDFPLVVDIGGGQGVDIQRIR